MDLTKLKKIMKLFHDSKLTEMEICEGDSRILLKNERGNAAPPPSRAQKKEGSARADTAEGPGAKAAGGTADNKNAENAGTAARSDADLRAPLAGILYLSPAPGQKPFVSVGDSVKTGDVLCIIEAMKVMNEISAGKDGRVAEVCAENERLVEFGQILFRIV